MRGRLVETNQPRVFKLIKEEEPMRTKLVTLTINYPESVNGDNLEQYILEALSGSDDLRECFGEVIDIHDMEPQEEGDA